MSKILYFIDIKLSQALSFFLLYLIRTIKYILKKDTSKGNVIKILSNLSKNNYVGLMTLFTGKDNCYIYFKDKKIFVPHFKSFRFGFFEIFISEEYKFPFSMKELTILDCGCHIGLSIIYFKERMPNAHIKAFEADVQNYKASVYNIKSFNYSDVEIINKAIWINNHSIVFEETGGHSGKIVDPIHSNKIVQNEIPCQRLKDLVTQNKQFDILKMDIEGAEREVLIDLGHNIQYVNNIFLELHQNIGDSWVPEILMLLHHNSFQYALLEAKYHDLNINELNNKELNQLVLYATKLHTIDK